MIHVIKVDGPWDEGYILDKYIENSEFIGEDPFGHPHFNNTYTKIGGLLHSMKYNGHFDTSGEIVSCCSTFLKFWLGDKRIDIVLPVPPTLERPIQPVHMISKTIAKLLSVHYSSEVLVKTTKEQSKSMPKDKKNLKGSIQKVRDANRECNILLVDDLYSTGATASECVLALKDDNLINKVYYLAIAKTK